MAGRSPGTLLIRSHSAGIEHTIALAGELDFSVAAEVESAYTQALASDPERIVLDLTGLEFADCSAVRLLMDLAERSRSNGHRLELKPGPAQVHRVFELTGTAEQLPFSR
jgi:anti-sigma B factor antagonist